MATKTEAIIGMVQRGEKWTYGETHAYFSTVTQCFYDQNDNHFDMNNVQQDTGWERFQEPKKKVKMWQWLIKTGPGYYSNTTRFTAEAPLVNQNAKIIKKLDYTEIEVEVEG